MYKGEYSFVTLKIKKKFFKWTYLLFVLYKRRYKKSCF